MATQGLWNIGNINLPDFGISEKLGIGPNNLNVTDPYGMRNWEQTTQLPGSTVLSPNAHPALKDATRNYVIPVQPVLNPAQPASQPTPQPTQSNPNDAGWIKANFPGYQSWGNDAAIIADFKNTGGAGKGGGYTGGGETDWNAIYGPVLQGLNEQQAMIENEQPLLEGSVQKQADLAKGEVESELKTALQTGEKQTAQAQGSRQSALDEARALVAQSKQGIMSAYGQGTSAGGAMLELLYKGALDSQAKIESSFANLLGQIDDYVGQATDWAAREKSRIAQDSADKIQELRMAFTRQITAINQDKYALESEKATARANAAQIAQQNSQAIINAREQAKLNLETWITQQEYVAAAERKNLAAATQKAQQMIISVKPESSKVTTKETPKATSYLPQTQTVRQDEFSGLTNPFNA